MTNPTITIDPVLSVAQVSELTSLGRRTIWRLIQQGKLTPTKISTRRVGIKVSEINRYQTDLQKQAPAAA
jgi:excisionase family DNA binding protein